MNIYNYLFIYFVFVSLLENFNNRNLNKYLFFISFIILVIFGGIRFDTGWDYPGYQYYYEIIPGILEFISNYNDYSYIYFEPGFKILISLFKSFDLDFSIFIFTVNLITTFLFFVFINKVSKYSGYRNLIVLLYFSTVFLFSNFSVLRQGIAIGIWLCSLFYCKDNVYKYLFLVFIASLFHYSVSIFFIIPLLLSLNWNIKRVLLVSIIVLIIYIAKIHWIKSISFLLPDIIYNKLEHYMVSDRFGTERSLGFGFIEKVLFLMMLCYLYFIHNSQNYIKEFYKIFFVIYFIYFLCYLAFFELNILYDRTRLYFASFSICIFTLYIRSFTLQSRFIVWFFTVCYSLFMFNNILSSDQNKAVFIPYHTVFEEQSKIPEYEKGKLRISLGQDIDHNVR